MGVLRSGSLCLILASAFALTGCVAAVPLHTHVQGANSQVEEQDTADFRFIQPGVTTREDVARKLAWMDTGVDLPNVFIGRWRQSKSATYALIGGTGSSGTVVGGRNWAMKNVVVELADDKVVRFTPCGDEQLAATLQPMLAKSDYGAVSGDFVVEHRHGVHNELASAAIHLTADEVNFTEMKHSFRLKKMAVSDFQATGGAPLDNNDARYLFARMKLKDQTSVGKSAVFRVDMPTFVALLRNFPAH